jgi:hypothetical protein
MDARQRFVETLRPGSPDRVPFHDRELREDVVERWRTERLPAGVSASQYFDLDHWELIGPRRWRSSSSTRTAQ